MTPFATISTLAGLTLQEAGDLCGVRHDSARQWATGRRAAPPGAIDRLRDMIAAQTLAQIAALAQQHGAPAVTWALRDLRNAGARPASCGEAALDRG